MGDYTEEQKKALAEYQMARDRLYDAKNMIDIGMVSEIDVNYVLLMAAAREKRLNCIGLGIDVV